MSHHREIVRPIKFKIELMLEADLDEMINLRGGNSEYNIGHKDVLMVEREVIFSDHEHKIRLFEFSGFHRKPRPHIKIKEVMINGYRVRDFNHLFSFELTRNAHVENKLIEASDTISFNGHLNLETRTNRDRLIWFPTTYSKCRTSIVHRNEILNCQSGYGCFTGLDCRHDPLWQRYELGGGPYDCIALGCSITAGIGIRVLRSWPSLLGNNILNLGIPGGGCDAILNNLKCLLDNKIRFRKIVILFPNPGRRLYRIRKNGHFFNYPMSPSTQKTGHDGHFNIFFHKDQLDKIFDDKKKHSIMNFNPRRDQKIITRIIELLKHTDIEFYMSSWSKDTYQFLESLPIQKHLLPMFNEEGDPSTGRDGSHPAEHIHEKWVESIKYQIGLGEKTA